MKSTKVKSSIDMEQASLFDTKPTETTNGSGINAAPVNTGPKSKGRSTVLYPAKKKAQIPKSAKTKQIKSKRRVRDLGEVYTSEREVNNILALTQATSNRYWRFLEPACGNGNFLEAILRQRLDHLKQDRQEWHPKNREFSVLKVLSTIYGVDIAEDNIAECKKRLRGVIFDYLPKKTSKEFLFAIEEIMNTNLIVGDMLNGKDKIYFTEYSTPAKGFFKRRVYALTDMELGIETVIKDYPTKSYKEMTNGE